MKVILSIVVSMFCMLTTSALWGQSTCVFTAPYLENFDGNTWVSGSALLILEAKLIHVGVGQEGTVPFPIILEHDSGQQGQPLP